MADRQKVWKNSTERFGKDGEGGISEVIQAISEPSTIENLILNLQQKLDDINQGHHNNTEDGTIPQNEDSNLPPFPFNLTSETEVLLAKHYKMKHYDTIMLVGSCVIMIVLGLLMRKLFLYLAHVRETREKYQGGLRALAEQMSVVTHSMADATGKGGTEKKPRRETGNGSSQAAWWQTGKYSDMPKRKYSKAGKYSVNDDPGSYHEGRHPQSRQSSRADMMAEAGNWHVNRPEVTAGRQASPTDILAGWNGQASRAELPPMAGAASGSWPGRRNSQAGLQQTGNGSALLSRAGSLVEMDVFKPSTHAVVKEEDVGQIITRLEERKLSRIHECDD